MDAREYFEKGQEAFANGNHEESLKLFEQALDGGFDPVKTLLSRGAAYLNLNRYDNAVDDFNRVVDLDPDNERAYYYRGIAKLKTKQFEQAVEDLNTSLAQNAERGASFLARGLALAEIGKDDEAVADFKKAMSYANVETEKFVDTLGGDRTAFQRSLALIEGERLPVTSELNEIEMERLLRWMKA